MKPKPLKFAVALVLVATLAYGAYFLSRTSATGEKQLYTCSMHPQIVVDHPGDCPICGMKLTPIPKRTALQPAEDDGAIAIDAVTIQKMNLRTALVTKGPLLRQIRTIGVVDFDETSLADVTPKVKGWVEKVYVDSTGAQVHKGDPLFEFYSPELYGAQTEYLLALNEGSNADAPGAVAMRAGARTKLQYYDISEDQIAELEKSRQAKKTLRVTAPRDGIVVEKNAVEGQMADEGFLLYRLADLGVVWIQTQIYEQDLAYVTLGQEATVTLSYLPDRKFTGRVTYIYPTVDDKTRTARVRMEFHNPGYFLKPGMFATVELKSLLDDDAVLVPDSAVLRSGEKNTVFLALAGGRFEPRTVVLGARGEDDNYQVLDGLSAGARVVTSGQFMLDSESQLREAIQKMQRTPDADGDESSLATNPVPTPDAATTSSDGKIIAYVCPMPEHVGIQYDHPGDCPICGMKLVPITAETLGKLHPGTEVDYYVCPMPEHANLHYDKAGKCPICGMTLIPIMKPGELVKSPSTNAIDLPASK